MRRNKKSRILAVLLAVSLSGSSAVYAQAEEVNNPDPDIEICGEEHEMKEVQVVEPTCTEAGYVLWKCSSCDYEEKRDLKKALGHDLEVFSTEEATEDTPGKVVYRCKREKCDYTETNIISVAEPGTDDKENDKDNKPGNGEKSDVPADPNENDKTDNNGETKPDTGNESGEDSDKTEEPAVDEEELPDVDVDEEYASYASSTSTEVVAEYDPTTASHTIKVAKDAKHPEEVEEIEGKTVADNTARISRDEQGNITDLAISTEIEKIKNGFSLTSEAKTLKSISIINAKDLPNDWFTLNAGKTAGELGIHVEYTKDEIVLTLTENKKILNIVNVTEDETTITMKTSTGGSFGIRKNLQKFSTKLEGVVKGTKNRIVLKGTEGAKPSVELSYVKEKREDDTAVKETAEKDNETENKENDEDSANAEEERNEEHYWIRAYNDEVEDPIVITVYKK
ncbi:hypothetical protein [Blautia sp. Marseille-P3087]|uniref:hypothetical protein n=1 Tax=Blautia sp. Marseille-P3087 TaxID=1917876 RepID=UPI000930093D|nr:hypothetical protein [Blautia sp. Marseille-P3087]